MDSCESEFSFVSSPRSCTGDGGCEGTQLCDAVYENMMQLTPTPYGQVCASTGEHKYVGTICYGSCNCAAEVEDALHL